MYHIYTSIYINNDMARFQANTDLQTCQSFGQASTSLRRPLGHSNSPAHCYLMVGWMLRSEIPTSISLQHMTTVVRTFALKVCIKLAVPKPALHCTICTVIYTPLHQKKAPPRLAVERGCKGCNRLDQVSKLHAM